MIEPVDNVTQGYQSVISRGSLSGKEPLVLKHLEQVFDACTNQLFLADSLQLAHLLSSYEDVFARSEFELGHFSGFEQTIDTGQTSPDIKYVAYSILFYR